MSYSAQRVGEASILSSAILWGLFPVLTILSYTTVPPLFALGLSMTFSAVFFIGFISIRKKWHEIWQYDALFDIVWATFFIGIIFYSLLFLGLRYTSAGNASIIALTETFFTYLLFHVWRREYIPWAHVIGAFFMLLGAGIVLYPNVSQVRVGDFLILLAASIAPLGNFFQRRARRRVSSETIMCIRSVLVLPVVFAMALIFGERISFTDLRTSLLFLLVNGVVLFGFSKIFWIEGIHRISVTKANALSGVTPLFTLLFAWLFLHDVPTLWQLFSLFPMLAGMMLLGTDGEKKRSTNDNVI